MENCFNHIEAYILAGGKSSRMGTDKGLMLFNGKYLAESIIGQLEPVFKKIRIVTNNPEYKKFGFETIEDLIKNIGPAGGIHSALSNTTAAGAFIISCDMPFVTTGAIEYITRQSMNSQITLPIHHGKIEPLCGVYSRECLPKWVQLLEIGIIKLQELITHFSLSGIHVEDQLFFSEKLFMNLNDKNDFKKALEQK